MFRLFILLAVFFLYIPAFFAKGHAYIEISTAASYATLSHSSPKITYVSGTLITDAYPLNHLSPTSPLIGLKGGYEFSGKEWNPAIMLGLGFYSTLTPYHFNGSLIETATGNNSNKLYTYRYHVASSRLIAEAQFTWMIKTWLPFVQLGVGPSWNSMRQYAEMAATSDGYVPLPPFQSSTMARLAYQVGVGIGKSFNFSSQNTDFQNRISVGYRYANLGRTSFGTRGALYPYSLNTGTLATNDLFLSYAHLF